MIDELISAAIFSEVPYNAMKDIEAFCTSIELGEGDTLISENDSDSDLYILCDGALEVVSSSSKDTSGEVVISKQNYNVFGEITWLTNNRRTATLRCRGSVNAIQIDGKALMTYLEDHPEVGFEIMRNTARIVAERLENTNTLIKQILWNSNI